LDTEVFTRDALERADALDRSPASREHATPYIYRHPEAFRLLHVAATEDASEHRWCVDTAEDYELVRRIYEVMGDDRFGWRDALELVRSHPDWADLNRHVAQKPLAPE
jgi:spore coat polysaccharide biosynthesis protein SpsF